MSRAFVREPDGDEVVDTLPELPQQPIPNYVTPEGMAALEARRAALRKEREELEPHTGTILDSGRLARVGRDLRYIEGRIGHAVVVGMAKQPRHEVAFGARVAVRDENGRDRVWRIVGEDEADIAKGLVSWISPLARALNGAGVGDVVTWRRPAGDLELEIAAISYPRPAVDADGPDR